MKYNLFPINHKLYKRKLYVFGLKFKTEDSQRMLIIRNKFNYKRKEIFDKIIIK